MSCALAMFLVVETVDSAGAEPGDDNEGRDGLVLLVRVGSCLRRHGVGTRPAVNAHPRGLRWPVVAIALLAGAVLVLKWLRRASPADPEPR
jgi:hypothetical protein